MRIAGICHFETIHDPKVQNISGEPVGLELVLASAQKQGHETGLFLPAQESEKGLKAKSSRELVREVLDFEPDVAAFSLYTCQFDWGKEIAEKLKQGKPEIRIVAGNRHPTTNTDGLSQPFDFYVIGEGEQSFVELLHEMGNGGNYSQVKGIAFKANGKLVITEPRPFIKNLDAIPNALRHPLLLKQTYNGLGYPAAGKKPRITIMEYSRGCPGFCKFCDNTFVWKRNVRFRSAENTVKEMIELKKNGINMFYFMDLNFTAFPKKTIEFCDAIKESGQEFNWYCMSNISTAIPKVLKRMKEAGCFKLNYGIESTNNESLKQMRKGLAKEKILQSGECMRVLKKTQKTGLMAGGYYIIGFPWETKDSILRDAQQLRKYAVHCLNVGIATPHPGTSWRQEFKGSDLINCWRNYDRKHLCYKHASLDEKTIQELQAKIYLDFYQSKEYLDNAQELVSIEPKFRDSFNDYFKLQGMKLKV